MISHLIPGWKFYSEGYKRRNFIQLFLKWQGETSEDMNRIEAAFSRESDQLEVSTLAIDLNGTSAVGGLLVPGVEDLLNEYLDRNLRVVMLTGDVRGTARLICDDLGSVGTKIELIDCKHEKGIMFGKFDWLLNNPGTVFFGNGNGDALTGIATLTIAVCQGEGMTGPTADGADVIFTSIVPALEMPLSLKVMKATLHCK
jgi:soluble P-type ATPase